MKILKNTNAAQWILKHINDRYVKQAQLDNYRSRAAYKLIELDDKYLFIRKHQTIVEFGCFPGGWSQVLVDKSLASVSDSLVIGVDKIAIEPLQHFNFIQGDIMDENTILKIKNLLGNRKANLVVSDLSAATIGIKVDDHLNSVELAMRAAKVMEQIIAIDGWFVVKIFMGSQLDKYKVYMRSLFNSVYSCKPSASRSTSPEMYFVCKGFQGVRNISKEIDTHLYNKTGLS